jgi:hypothetical protein
VTELFPEGYATKLKKKKNLREGKKFKGSYIYRFRHISLCHTITNIHLGCCKNRHLGPLNKENSEFFFTVCRHVVFLIFQKLNKYISNHNYVLFIIQNYKFGPVCGHPQVQNWPLKITEEEVYIM